MLHISYSTFCHTPEIEKCYDYNARKNPEQIVPMVSYSFPPQRSNYIDENGYAQYVFPESKMTRSQDLDKWYHDAGQFYVYNVKKFLNVMVIVQKLYLS